MTVGSCNKCGECKELVLVGCMCASCSDRLGAYHAPGPSDKVHSILVALKESLGSRCDIEDRLTEPIRYIFRNTTYAEMKSLRAKADPPGLARLGFNDFGQRAAKIQRAGRSKHPKNLRAAPCDARRDRGI